MRITSSRGRQPFEVSLKEDQRTELTLELCRALDAALAARSATEDDVAYWHTLYEQGRTRTARNSPWADAADLTSYLGTFYVDTMRSQIVQTVMTEPVWTVEGYGESAKNAPYVEEFHQWQQEAEGFQRAFARAAHLALIEPMGVLECYEDTVRRPVRKTMQAALQLAPDGTVLLDEKLLPQLQKGPDGKYVEALDPGQPAGEVEIDSYETISQGPRERVIAYRDFLILPGHARDRSEVWGYAKRFWRRVDELEERAEAGVYDETAVDELGTDDERASDTTLAGDPITVAAKDGTELVEKELWELLILRDLDGKGLRWFTVTLHKDKQVLLRIQYDDIGRPRYFPLVPFPRPNTLEGYSFIGHKLITVIEEHTVWRNMTADDASMQLQLPVVRKQGALWTPEDQPLGPKAVIDVRDPQEVTFMQRQPNSGIGVERIQACERIGEKLAGINDASAGVTSEDQRTLGEIQLITQQSQGRISEAIRNIQETLEELAQVRHLMWKRVLATMPQGMPAPPSVNDAIALRTQPPQGPPTHQLVGLEQWTPSLVTTTAPQAIAFTAQMLEGTFRFKPKGSVETADKNRQRYDWNQFILAASSLSKVNPMIMAILSTPQAAKALMEQTVRLYNVPDKQAFLGSEALAAAQMQLQQQQLAAMMGGAPGAGGPPMAGPPKPNGAAVPNFTGTD